MASEAEAVSSEMPHLLHILVEGWQLPCPLAAIFLAFLAPQSFPTLSDNGLHWCERLAVERNTLHSLSPCGVTPSLFPEGLKSDWGLSGEALLANFVEQTADGNNGRAGDHVIRWLLGLQMCCHLSATFGHRIQNWAFLDECIAFIWTTSF